MKNREKTARSSVKTGPTFIEVYITWPKSFPGYIYINIKNLNFYLFKFFLYSILLVIVGRSS
jgi:hypothetical protein